MATLQLKECTPDDLRFIAENLRDQDEVEVSLLTRSPMVDVLVASQEASIITLGIFLDGKPAGVFGLTEVSPEVGAPWLLGTDLLVKHSREWLGVAPAMRDLFHSRYPTLMNMLHTKNTRSKRWLKKLGFSFLPDAIPGCPNFEYFIRTRQDV